MWNVDPKMLCDKHLLGEHVETHMFVGTLNKGRSVKGFLAKGLLEVHTLKKRHDDLVAEMERRGMTHSSPLPNFKEEVLGSVNVEENVKELKRRCVRCLKRTKNAESIPEPIDQPLVRS